MNRTTAILLALGILLAHSLGIHRDFQWNFAGPYDSVHLAYALGENAAAGKGWTLGAGGPGLQAYPSPLWVGLAWLVKSMDWPVERVAQMVDLVAALLLISASTRIAKDRVAGVIPPVLLVLSGTMASGAVSGTEHMVLACLLVVSLVSYAKGRTKLFAFALLFMALTRAEGLILLGAWFAIWSVDRWRGQATRPIRVWVFAPAAILGSFFCWYTPVGETHSLYGAVYLRLLDSHASGHGWDQLLDFTKVAVSPIWMLLGVAYLVAGKLSAVGVRAFTLTCVYTLVLVLAGGEDLPFALAFLPVLPLICIVIQEIIVAALDTYRPGLEAASWVLLLATSLAAASASKFPGDVGPLSLGNPHTAWLESRSEVSLGQNKILGRTQLQTEIRRTSEMQRLALFLAKHLDPKASVLSPWVGSLTQYTPNPIMDWFSRLQTVGDTPQRANMGHPAGAPLSNALHRNPDVVLPAIGMGAQLGANAFIEGLNPVLLELGGDTDEVKQAMLTKLHNEYRLVALPITHPTTGRATPFFIYQRLSTGDRPELHVEGEAGLVHIEVQLQKDASIRLPQMVYLVVFATDADGHIWIPEPSGTLVQDAEGQSSTAAILLNAMEASRVRLWSGELSTSPSGSPIRSIEAQLFQPGVSRKNPLAPASNLVRIGL